MPTVRPGCVHCGSYACLVDLARPALCRHTGLARDPAAALVAVEETLLDVEKLAAPAPAPRKGRPGRQKEPVPA